MLKLQTMLVQSRYSMASNFWILRKCNAISRLQDHEQHKYRVILI